MCRKFSWLLLIVFTLQCAASIGVGGTYSSRVLSHSPQAYWRLNETSGTLADDTANSNNGTYVNGVTLNQAGAFIGDSDTAANFDGSNDRVTLGTISVSGGDMTIIAWIRPANFTNANARIIAKASSATEANTYWMLALDNSSGSQRFAFRVRTGGVTTTLVATSGTLSTNTWYMLAAVYDGAQMRLYLDGQPVGSVAKTGTLNTSGSINTWIGQNPDSTNAYAGRIDDVAVFDSALMQAEINELYVDSGRALIGHWAMDENAGQTAADSSPYVHNVTLGSTTSSESIDPAWTTSSKVGAAALTFDGTADYALAANTAAMSFTSEVTIAAWIRTTSLSGQRVVLQKGTNYALAIDGSNLLFAFYNGSTITYTTTALGLKANVWYHAAATFHNSGDRVRIYLNGNLVQSWSTTSVPITDTSPIYLGRSSLGTYWSGTLDEVRLYNRELSAAQIAALGSASLIGHWKLDETSGTTASDISGNANNGTLTGLSFTSDSVQGRDMTGLNFGGNDYISVADHASVRPTSGLTITAWVKGDSWGSSSNANAIVRKGTDNPNNYQLAIADGHIALMLDDSDTGGIRGDTFLVGGQWYHVAATWDGSHVRIYLNGVLDMASPVARSGLIATDTRPLYIGGRTSGDYFDGVIDDVRLYNYALSAAEIRTVYGLLGHWKFDEAIPATTAIDSSGNGYSAPLHGNSTWTTGRVDGAITFDGAGDYAATTSTSFPPPTDGSISFWMKTTALSGTQRLLATTPDWEIRQAASGVVSFDINGDTRFETGALQAGKWYHLVAMFDDTNDKYALYINGALHLSGTQTYTPQSASSFTFGVRASTTEYYHGALDDVRIYNRRLMLDEVAEQYNGASPLGVHILKWNEVQ